MSDSGSSEKGSAESLSSVLAKDSRLANELRLKLSSLSNSRTALAKQLRHVNSELKAFVAKIAELKSARDKETAYVKELKPKRQEANEAIKAIAAELKNAAETCNEAKEKLAEANMRQRKSQGQLSSELEALEMKIVTEAMPFAREQQLMKIIKEKKKQLELVKTFYEAAASHKETYEKFSQLRKQSNSFHKELQQYAGESQRLHEEMLKLLPGLKDLRQQRKTLLEQLNKVKGDYSVADSELQQRLHELSEVKEKLDTIAAVKKREMEEKKEQELTEKLKSGKKLTASDLMMLQQCGK